MKRLAWVLVLLTGCPPDRPPNVPSNAPREQLVDDQGWQYGYRTRVPGGWIVEMRNGACFLPDPDGAWLSSAVEVSR